MDVVLHSGVDYGRGIRKVTGMYDSNIQSLRESTRLVCWFSPWSRDTGLTCRLVTYT